MANRLRRALSRRRSRRAPSAVVLRYHRVADLGSDPHATAVSPVRFGEHLEVLRRHFTPVHLAALVGMLREGHPWPLSPRAVVVTFDDGYVDNLTAAAPLLERYDVPATVFVTTGQIDRGQEFWWDTLERVLLVPGHLPSVLELTIAGEAGVWPLGPGSDYSRRDFERHKGWNWRQKRLPTTRHRLFRELFRRLQPLEESARQPVIGQLLMWAGTAADVRPSHRTLSADEMVQLNAHDQIDIGAHSVTHPLFTRLTPERQAEEIESSKTSLEEILGAPVTSFAYPYGDHAGTAPAVARAGFDCACTTEAQLVSPGQDPFLIPRLYAGDWDGDQFTRELGRWT